eukprot:5659005-Pyramimonas_sp.AAC.1
MSHLVHWCRCFAFPGGAALLTECSTLRFKGIQDPKLVGARDPSTWDWFLVAGTTGAAGARGIVGALEAGAADGKIGPPGCLVHLEPVARIACVAFLSDLQTLGCHLCVGRAGG